MMKKLIKIVIAIVLVVVIVPSSFAQKKKRQEEEVIQPPKMPVDEKSKLVKYSGLVEVKGTKADLFATGLNWVNTFYKNPSNVIRTKNEIEGKIFGKARFNIWGKDVKTGDRTNDGLVLYEITIQFKDGKYKYSITDIVHKKNTAFPIERWIEENDKAYHAKYASYLVQVDEYMQKLIKGLTNAMSAGNPKSEEDW